MKKNYYVAPSSRRQQRSFALHLIFQISISEKRKVDKFLVETCQLILSMGYKKDIYAIFVYEFELLRSF